MGEPAFKQVSKGLFEEMYFRLGGESSCPLGPSSPKEISLARSVTSEGVSCPPARLRPGSRLTTACTRPATRRLSLTSIA
jgi:hypothetical protein